MSSIVALLQLKGQTLSEILLKSASARRTEVEGLLTPTYGLVAALFPTAADALAEKGDITTATLLLLIGGGGVTGSCQPHELPREVLTGRVWSVSAKV